MEGANMQEIVKIAQKVASNMNIQDNIDPNNIDMNQMLSQVTQSVSQMLTPEILESMTNSNKNNTFNNNAVNNKNTKSKIKLKQIEEVSSDEDADMIAPRTKDLHFTLNVTLEDLYCGKTKKLAVRRKRLITDGKKKQLVEEKKKINVIIEPGMYDEQVITFNKQADEKEGYETGDIIITLCCSEHEDFERENDNLIIEKEISLSEVYKINMTLTHLDGKELNILSSPINIFGEELESYRKLKGYGMPIHGTDEYGDLIIKFKPVLPENLTEDQYNLLEQLFPRLNSIKQLETQHQLEIVTESDFDFSDDSDSESESDDSESYSDDSDEEEEEELSNDDDDDEVPNKVDKVNNLPPSSPSKNTKKKKVIK
jgi:DnaJ-class molecular chaperone